MASSSDSVVWIPAPTSGILHVDGEGYSRKEVKAGTRLLCGWVISVTGPRRVKNLAYQGRRCATCAKWLRLNAAAEVNRGVVG